MITAALLVWPLVMLVLAYALPWPRALVISILGGFLFLPEVGMWFDPPLLPPIDKQIIPSATAFALALVLRPGAISGSHLREPTPRTASAPRSGILPATPTALVGLGLVLLGMIGTALTNGDTLHFAETDYTRPALRLYDGVALAVDMLPMVLPFLLGRKYLAHPDQQRMILWVVAIAGLIYSLPALWEIRMSPRLNVQFYGFFPHNWHQHIRGGGYRPIVFLPHGLFLALFFALVAMAFFGLARIEERGRGLLLLGGVWVLMTLAMSNSLTGLLIAICLCPPILLFGRRIQLTVAAVIALLILVYPTMRMTNLVPTDRIVAMAESINPARALSLNYRFENETLIMDHVRERPLLGWGGYGRNRVYDDQGRGVDTVDSSWIVALGVGGWVQFIGLFGLLAAPIVLLWKNRNRFEITTPTAVLCLMVAGTMIDLLANSGLTPVTWLIVGSLFGRLELGRIADTETEVQPIQNNQKPSLMGARARPTSAPSLPYTRQTTTRVRASRQEPF